MSVSEEDHSNELNFVFLGVAQKTALFDKLCEAAAKYERHVHYPDTHYLTVRVGDREDCVEVTDPGLARTGAREMAIRNADVALLYYSAYLPTSLTQLTKVKDDLLMKKNMPVRVICDMDETIDYEEDGGSTGLSSQSEGYESDNEHESRIRRQPSMEIIRKQNDEGAAAIEMGRQFSTELGDSCVFIQLSSSQYQEADGLLRDMIDIGRSRKKRRRSRSIIPNLNLRRRSKSRDPRVSPQTSLKSEPSTSDDGTSRKSDDTKNSKVCSIM